MAPFSLCNNRREILAKENAILFLSFASKRTYLLVWQEDLTLFLILFTVAAPEQGRGGR